MIVVFVIDTSPSMGEPIAPEKSSSSSSSSTNSTNTTTGMSRLDLAKMAVESLTKGLNKRIALHNGQLQSETTSMQKSLHNLGLGYTGTDQFLLLSTGRQYTDQPAAVACGAGGRLLVGYGDNVDPFATSNVDAQGNPIGNAAGDHSPSPPAAQHHGGHGGFERELKRLQATLWSSSPSSNPASAQPQRLPFPEDGGGAMGLNVALSAGLQLLSRYRLHNRSTENWGMGRLPSPAMLTSGGGGIASSALQPACLVLITDGSCLRKPPTEGGGSLQLQFGNMPLREFYREPFRWDQRIFCIGVGARDGISSTQYLHPSLRALCEVTGGGHCLLRSVASLSHVSDMFMKLIAPPRPPALPLQDPLQPQQQQTPSTATPSSGGSFVNGGPVCSFQCLEGNADGTAPTMHRAMLLYVPYKQIESTASTTGVSIVATSKIYQPPLWCIPEAFFPSKKLDTLPPRPAQPLLMFSRHYQVVGSNIFDPLAVMKMLNRLDQLIMSNRQATMGSTTSTTTSTGATGQQQQQQTSTIKLLQRDVYVCEWLSQDCKGGYAAAPRTHAQREYLPVCVRGAGRPSLADGEDNLLSIGILRIPPNTSTLTAAAASSSPSSGATSRLSTLTLLPPEPHILLPLLLKAAEVEHRAIKKAAEKEKAAASTASSIGGGGGSGATAGLIQKQSGPTTVTSAPRNILLDENWRSEFRAYMFRVPPYYQNALKRGLRPVLPASAHSLLATEGIEALAGQCFSKLCLQKIRTGEQMIKETNDRLERQELELRRRGVQKPLSGADGKPIIPTIGYGQYDPRATTCSYLAALRNMPAPWHVGLGTKTTTKGGGGGGGGKDISSGTTTKVECLSQDGTISESASMSNGMERKLPTAVETLADLPQSCLLPYYESRRRWIFGGTGLTTRGLHVEGVNNDGTNSQYYSAKHSIDDESLLSLADIGASSLNKVTTVKMGDYRERLLWSRAPVVGYGSNDSSGAAATTAADGSPTWSVDDDAMPLSFFDPKSGEFSDSVQARVRSRLMVNFGNPYKDKRGDSLIPDKFQKQRPPLQQEIMDDESSGPHTPPGSPPHDNFTSVEGEGEAVFASPTVRKHHHRPSPKRESLGKREADEALEETTDTKRQKKEPTSSKATDEPIAIGESTNTIEKAPPVPPRKPVTSPAGPPPKMVTPGNTPRPAPPPSRKRTPHTEKRAPPPPPVPPMRKPPPPAEKRATTGNPPPPRSEKRPQQNTMPPKPANPNAPQQQQEQQQSRAPPPVPKPRKAQPPPPPQMDLQSPDRKPKVDLPPGWMCVWSKSQKRWYFFDTKTNKSVWQWPPPGGLPR